MDDATGDELSSTQAQPVPQQSVAQKANTYIIPLERRHRFCIKNTPILNDVTNSKVGLQWFNIPYKDMRFYWTPKELAEAQTVGDLIRVKNINFSCHGFQAQFDVQYTAQGSVKVDAKPTHDPLLWTYIDCELNPPPPPRDHVTMDQKSLGSIKCLKGDSSKSMLKLWQCKNTSYTPTTGSSRGQKSTTPTDFFIWEEDVEIANQPEFREMTLGDTFSHSEDIDMSWLLVNQNMQPHKHARDYVGTFAFPAVNNGKSKRKNRSGSRAHTVDQMKHNRYKQSITHHGAENFQTV